MCVGCGWVKALKWEGDGCWSPLVLFQGFRVPRLMGEGWGLRGDVCHTWMEGGPLTLLFLPLPGRTRQTRGHRSGWPPGTSGEFVGITLLEGRVGVMSQEPGLNISLGASLPAGPPWLAWAER